jgi:hypothetical protein
MQVGAYKICEKGEFGEEGRQLSSITQETTPQQEVISLIFIA